MTKSEFVDGLKALARVQQVKRSGGSEDLVLSASETVRALQALKVAQLLRARRQSAAFELVNQCAPPRLDPHPPAPCYLQPDPNAAPKTHMSTAESWAGMLLPGYTTAQAINDGTNALMLEKAKTNAAKEAKRLGQDDLCKTQGPACQGTPCDLDHYNNQITLDAPSYEAPLKSWIWQCSADHNNNYAWHHQ